MQEPIPELDRLHRGDPVILESVDIPEDLALPVEGIVGPSLDIRIELHRLVAVMKIKPLLSACCAGNELLAGSAVPS